MRSAFVDRAKRLIAPEVGAELRAFAANCRLRRLMRANLDDQIRRVGQLVEARKVQEAQALLTDLFVVHPREPRLTALSQRVGGQREYDHRFYDTQSAPSLRSARVVLSLLRRHLAFSSVVDVGAGVGSWGRAAKELGAADVLAIDGEWVMQSPLRNPELEYVFGDLNESIAVDRRFDLAICVEVAEHVRPERGPSLVDELCALSDAVLFGAALPHQPGNGHINCRPHGYWIGEFARNRYVCLDPIRGATWNDERVMPWYAQNSFLFVGPSLEGLAASVPAPSLLDVYHPLLVNPAVLADRR